MNNDSITDTHAASDRRKGLFIAIAAAMVLLALAAYRMPLFHDELDGVIMGVSEVYDETGSKLVAVVQLETGVQVLVSMHSGFLIQKNVNVRVNEARSLFGRKSYRIVAYKE